MTEVHPSHTHPDLLAPAKIGIIGNGYVGGATAYGFREASRGRDTIRIYDSNPERATHSFDETIKESDYIFVCLPTPMYRDGSGIDLGYLNGSLDQITPITDDSDKLIILKSTIVPQSTARFQIKYYKSNFSYNPEFLTEENHLNDFLYAPRTVLGTFRSIDATALATLYRPRFPETHIYQTDPTTAEQVKYSANVFLALKVTMANILEEWSQSLGNSWSEVADIFSDDPRIGKSHLQVTSKKGFGGKCLPKDLEAAVADMKRRGVDCKVLEEVIAYNKRRRIDHDWLNIPGAVSDPPTDRDELIPLTPRQVNEALRDVFESRRMAA